ncbi:chloramphenicol acetyltransferase [Pedobacter nutrimenti]|jgi:chloramphenicol O-acetyltransferase type A|uniref:Chloramphenicol O-acetyltransferase type A n=1 Tax=Pedobacter nutrimenti TaxID=1241337 RepID=A0A318V0D4_9SPHI|nr:chloramphenicol acetyltransferase [Pedobacter nutrimenti]PYF77309.1 chloramphenicol O-acetyltransferase type A [Pedobacter nutrimenti]
MNHSAKTKIDISAWKRKDHFYFFKDFEQPFFGISTALNCTSAYRYCKAYQIPFFLFYLHKSLMAVNALKEFKHRIEQDQVCEYECISGSVTVLRRDETFGFAYFGYDPDFKVFCKEVKEAIAQEKVARGLQSKADRKDVIHFSVLTGIEFTALQHAQKQSADSIPKIVFGKVKAQNGQVLMPLSIHVHHALCDGVHVSKLISSFQQHLELF